MLCKIGSLLLLESHSLAITLLPPFPSGTLCQALAWVQDSGVSGADRWLMACHAPVLGGGNRVSSQYVSGYFSHVCRG